MDTQHTDTEKGTASRPEFLSFLAKYRRGRLADELTEKLAELTDACMETEKAGTISLTLKVTPDKKVPGAVTVENTVGLKKPELPRVSEMYFQHSDGTLRGDREDQDALPFDGGIGEGR